MNFSLAVLFATSLLIPIAAPAQMNATEPRRDEAPPPILAMTASSRAGISAGTIAHERERANPDTAVKHISAGTRISHALAGGLVGILAGGGIGAAIGAYRDHHTDSHEDYGLTNSAVGGILGAAVGLLFGAIIGADWP